MMLPNMAIEKLSNAAYLIQAPTALRIVPMYIATSNLHRKTGMVNIAKHIYVIYQELMNQMIFSSLVL